MQYRPARFWGGTVVLGSICKRPELQELPPMRGLVDPANVDWLDDGAGQVPRFHNGLYAGIFPTPHDR